jgi:putative membrane protein
MALNDNSLITQEALTRIEQAVAQAEKGTSCELAVVLAPASSRYEIPVVQILGVITVVAFILLDLLNFFLLETEMLGNPLALMGCSLALGTGIALFITGTSLRQKLVSPKAQRKAVDLAAAASFWEQKIGFTKEHNAVLIYVSVMEGQARVLPDAGATAKIADAKFGEIEKSLNDASSAGAEAVCEAIANIGVLVKVAFPRAASDANEVPDKPVIRIP